MRLSAKGLLSHVAVVALAFMAAGIWLWHFGGNTLVLPPDADLPDGSRYYGELHLGRFHGQGKILWPNGTSYEGEFREGVPSGAGTRVYADGSKYVGEVMLLEPHGQGRLEHPGGATYEGVFAEGKILEGVFLDGEGGRYEGGFSDELFHGPGEYTDSDGNRYRGEFEYGVLSGEGSVSLADGGIYQGEFSDWLYHGRGQLVDAKGNRYQGEFAYGSFHGEGEIIYAAPVDGVELRSGLWEYGSPAQDPANIRARQKELELAIYAQDSLLRQAVEQLLPQNPAAIDLYFLGVAGDAQQDVFRKEVRFVRTLFDQQFGTAQRSLNLINHADTLATHPLASGLALERILKAIAAKMDPQQDILFLYMTSHGSPDHHFSINISGIDLPAIAASELAQALQQAGIKWKVIAISACYSGGFIPLLQDDHTLVMTAADADRTSFGCGDDSDMTYFGRAYFEQALPAAQSFEAAFAAAKDLIRQREKAELPGEPHSNPQIASGVLIAEQLKKWWAQAREPSPASAP